MNYNIYYSPEKFGLEEVGEVERGGGYDFDTFVVWRDISTGSLWYASDSGCSCPTPFDDIGRDDLTAIDMTQDLIDALDEWKGDYYEKNDRYDGEIGALIVKAREVGVWGHGGRR